VPIYLILIFNITLIGQSIIPLSTAEKFNERGISTSSSLSQDGNLLIGDYDGNLSLAYSQHYNLPNGLDHDITLIYNANVEHKVFFKYNSANSGYMVNSPEWIVGVKGFAVQTFNFETNYYSMTNNEGQNSLEGEEVAQLIPGYHYTNRNISLNTSQAQRDYITILRADGTKLILYNRKSGWYSLTGTYIEGNKEGAGYAIVKEREDATGLRRMWYKPGDGLTYYFEEEAVLFNDRDVLPLNWENIWGIPRAMYFKSVISATQDTLLINYSSIFHGEYNDTNLQTLIGRKIFKGTSSNHITSHWYDVNFSNLSLVFYDFLEIPSFVETKNDLHSITFSKQLSQESFTAYFYNTYGSIINIGSRSNDYTHTKKKIVSNTMDKFGNITTYTYDFKPRKYKNNNEFSFTQPNYLMTIINNSFPVASDNNGKITTLSYHDPSVSIEYDYNVSWPLICEMGSMNLSNITELMKSYRDNFTNFMVNKKEVENKFEDVLVNKITYDYEYIWKDGNEPKYTVCNKIVEDIKTKITKTGSDGLKTITTKNFSKYRTNFIPYNSDSYASLIKLRSSIINKVNSTDYTESIYNWYIGDANYDMYDGSFWLKSIEKKEKIGEFIKSNTQTYNYNSINILDNKIVKTYNCSTDKNAFKEEKYWEDGFLPVNFGSCDSCYSISDTAIDFYYNKNLIHEERSFKGDTTKISKQYQYYSTSNQKIGKLYKIFDKCDTNNIVETTFNYFTDTDNFYYSGLIKSKTSDNGLEQRYSYPKYVILVPEVVYGQPGSPTIMEEINDRKVQDSTEAYLISDDGSKTLTIFSTDRYQKEPFLTETIDVNTTDTLRSWSRYDLNGSLLFEVDLNSIYSEYKYDLGGRLVKAKLPGSFFPNDETKNDTLFSAVYNYDYLNNEINIQKRIDFLTNSSPQVQKLRYDAVGQLRESQIKDESSIFITKRESKFNSFELKSSDTDGMGRKVTYDYDYLGRVISTKYYTSDGTSLPGTITTEYYIIDPNSVVHNYVSTTKSISYFECKIEIDGEGKRKHIYFDFLGNVLCVLQFKSNSLTDVNNFIFTKFEYDNLYRLLKVTSPLGLVNEYRYDLRGNINYKKSPDAGETKYAYDKYGNLRFEQHASLGKAWLNTYDAFNRMECSGEFTNTYTNFVNLLPDSTYTNETLESNMLTINMYDEFSTSGIFPNVSFSYSSQMQNLKGRLAGTAFRDAVGDSWNYKFYSYDPLGRVDKFWIKESNMNNWMCITNDYNHIGNLIKQTISESGVDKFYTWYKYDVQGRLDKVFSSETNSESTAYNEAVYSYNNADQIDSTYLNENNILITQNYNARGWVSSINKNSAISFMDSLTYLNNGNVVTQKVNNGGSSAWSQLNNSFTYDGLNRLISSSFSDFSYNDDGGIKTKMINGEEYYYSYSGGTNKLASVISAGSPISFLYDSRGNITSDGMSNVQISTSNYNRRNLPLTVTANGSTIKYKYDDQGQRIYKEVGTDKQYYLRDNNGREIAVYNATTKKIKFINVYGNGLIGRVKFYN